MIQSPATLADVLVPRDSGNHVDDSVECPLKPRSTLNCLVCGVLSLRVGLCSGEVMSADYLYSIFSTMVRSRCTICCNLTEKEVYEL